MVNFVVIFKANFAGNRLVLRWSDQCFYRFSNRGYHLLFQQRTIHSRNEPMAKPLTSWLVPSFSQYNWCLVVSGCCLHESVTKFQDKFASLQHINSPNTWNKFQICCTDIYLIRFLPNFTYFACFCEFRGSVTAQNIRNPDNVPSIVFLTVAQWCYPNVESYILGVFTCLHNTKTCSTIHMYISVT